MSIDICVFTRPDRVPARNDWQRCIDEAGFPQQLDAEFDVARHEGYVPCRVEESEIGFEYEVQPLDETLFPADLRQLFEPETVCVRLSVPVGSPKERVASAMMAASALARSSGGRMWRDSGFIDVPDPVEWVRGWISS
ncbi:hypothetical protein [Motiliproteus sediminis]|uniref:hypothetical protein n=1 Tax=Motiliproteus sediminis TaxID=1468178 RepID=UPI001AEF54B2|nr:hypothetical protein [Motiliproteus sediminis]